MFGGSEVQPGLPVLFRKSTPTIPQIANTKVSRNRFRSCRGIGIQGPLPGRSPRPLTSDNHADPDCEWKRKCCQTNQSSARERAQDYQRKRADKRESGSFCHPEKGGLGRNRTLVIGIVVHGRARSCSMSSRRYRVKGTPFAVALAFIASSRLSESRMFKTADFGSNSKLDGPRTFSAPRVPPIWSELIRFPDISLGSPDFVATKSHEGPSQVTLAFCIYNRNAVGMPISARPHLQFGGVRT